MKTAVFTIAMGDYSFLASITHPNIKAYADKIGADFIVADKQEISQTTPHWEKFRIYNLLNTYERIIYIDTDIIVRPDCPNLFDIVPKGKLGAFNEGAFVDRSYAFTLACEQMQFRPNWDGCYYNTGVLVISRCHKELFKKPEQEIPNFYEQSYLNFMIAKNNIDVFQMPYKFNRMTIMDRITGEERHASYIIHYAGACDPARIITLAQRDIEKWKQTGPEYNYKKHIFIDVRGGLGDQINAEPTIRFALKNVWKNEDIIVSTHFPELFRHLNCKVYNHNEIKFEPDTPYYHCITLTEPDKPDGILWNFLSNLMCHTVDWVSISVLRRTLPDVDKRVKLQVDLDDISEVIDVIGNVNFNELVVVHPGRHWENKTFPKDYWQSIIDKLQEDGYKVCIIGKNDETRGTVDIEVREGMIDTRDLLSLNGLIALISQCKVVLSNDSAPIHIAGAFDCGIVLIPTCKHEDHILPWRNGSKYWRAKSLCKKLMLDDYPSSPTIVESITADKITGPFEDYLPDTEDVINAVKELFITGDKYEQETEKK